jgi:hypothetical protein
VHVDGRWIANDNSGAGVTAAAQSVLALGFGTISHKIVLSCHEIFQFCAQPLTFPPRTRPATRIVSSPPTGTGRANAAAARHAPRGWLGARRGCIRGVLSAHHTTPRPASEQFPLPIPCPSGPSSLPSTPSPAMSSMREVRVRHRSSPGFLGHSFSSGARAPASSRLLPSALLRSLIAVLAYDSPP